MSSVLQCRNPVSINMLPHWNPKALLALNPTQAGFRCLATTLKGARCRNQIKKSDLVNASQILDELALSSPSNAGVNNKLKDVATLCLCNRYHSKPDYSQVNRVTDRFKARVHQEVLREMENQENPYRRILDEIFEPALQAARARLLENEEQLERVRNQEGRQESSQGLAPQQEPGVVEDLQVPLRPARIDIARIERQPEIQVPGNELEVEADVAFEQQLAEIDAAIARVRGERPRSPRPDELRQLRTVAEAMIDGVLPDARPPRPARIVIDEIAAPPQVPGPGLGVQAIIPSVSPPQNHVIRKPITRSCPICYEGIEDINDADWCRGTCGQNVHKGCFQQWVDIHFGPGTYGLMGGGFPVRCTFCRGLWVWE